jgi:hypothetical protein
LSAKKFSFEHWAPECSAGSEQILKSPDHERSRHQERTDRGVCLILPPTTVVIAIRGARGAGHSLAATEDSRTLGIELASKEATSISSQREQVRVHEPVSALMRHGRTQPALGWRTTVLLERTGEDDPLHPTRAKLRIAENRLGQIFVLDLELEPLF